MALARRNLLPQVDYLSTVSGGGYTGGFLTSFLATPTTDPALGLQPYQARQLAFRLGLKGDQVGKAVKLMTAFSQAFSVGIWYSRWSRFDRQRA